MTYTSNYHLFPSHEGFYGKKPAKPQGTQIKFLGKKRTGLALARQYVVTDFLPQQPHYIEPAAMSSSSGLTTNQIIVLLLIAATIYYYYSTNNPTFRIRRRMY